MTQEETLARLAESRQALHRAIQDLSDETMTQTPVEGVWTVKDLMGHIASWDQTCLTPLQRYADGGPLEVEVIEDYLAWNDVQAAHRRDTPLQAILDELTATRQELVAVAGKLSGEQWQQRMAFPWGGEGTIAQALGGLSWHEMEHARTIQRWREG